MSNVLHRNSPRVRSSSLGTLLSTSHSAASAATAAASTSPVLDRPLTPTSPPYFTPPTPQLAWSASADAPRGAHHHKSRSTTISTTPATFGPPPRRPLTPSSSLFSTGGTPATTTTGQNVNHWRSSRVPSSSAARRTPTPTAGQNEMRFPLSPLRTQAALEDPPTPLPAASQNDALAPRIIKKLPVPDASSPSSRSLAPDSIPNADSNDSIVVISSATTTPETSRFAHVAHPNQNLESKAANMGPSQSAAAPAPRPLPSVPATNKESLRSSKTPSECTTRAPSVSSGTPSFHSAAHSKVSHASPEMTNTSANGSSNSVHHRTNPAATSVASDPLGSSQSLTSNANPASPSLFPLSNLRPGSPGLHPTHSTSTVTTSTGLDPPMARNERDRTDSERSTTPHSIPYSAPTTTTTPTRVQPLPRSGTPGHYTPTPHTRTSSNATSATSSSTSRGAAIVGALVRRFSVDSTTLSSRLRSTSSGEDRLPLERIERPSTAMTTSFPSPTSITSPLETANGWEYGTAPTADHEGETITSPSISTTTSAAATGVARPATPTSTRKLSNGTSTTPYGPRFRPYGRVSAETFQQLCELEVCSPFSAFLFTSWLRGGPSINLIRSHKKNSLALPCYWIELRISLHLHTK